MTTTECPQCAGSSLLGRPDTPMAPPRTDWKSARSAHSNAVLWHGAGSPQAIATQAEFWCVRLCALMEATIREYPMNADQRARISLMALVAGR
jgi:hypothetical protein